MRLSRLTLSGFKSFADRTEFTFEDDVTGVVGPNGCGKSNIVDAIKWVLGERSSKSLRGKEMIDVIFAGSAGRKAAGMASVALTFENPVLDSPLPPLPTTEEASHGATPNGHQQHPDDGPGEVATIFQDRRRIRRALPIDADLVEVERRLYRDGASQYLINGRRARLRDIRELFLDTGVGADAYSIIEQGKVDAMLLANPMERRTIFEEAAGISKYKQRRTEAQRKLERTEANLALTREQLQSTERRLRIIKGQAAKARRFRELDSRLRAARMALAFDQYDDLRQRLNGLTSELSALERVRTQAAQQLADLEHQKQQAELVRHDLITEHRAAEQARLESEHAEESARQRRQMTERAAEEARARAELDEHRLRESSTQIAALEQDAADQSEALAALAERLAEAEADLRRAGEARGRVLGELAERQMQAAEARSALADIDRERAGLLAAAEADAHRISALAQQLVKLEGRAEEIDREHAELTKADRELNEAIERRTADIDNCSSDLARLDETIASLSEDRRQLASAVSDLEQQNVRLDTRRATLEELIQSGAGLGQAVQRVLSARDEGRGFAGVIAPLADLVETGPEHARAVEAALGPLLQALIVDSVASIPNEEELAELNGRAMFLPLAGLNDWSARPPTSPAEQAILSTGRVMRVRDLIRPRRDGARVGPLLDRLLDRCYLAPSLDAALLLAAGPLAGFPGGRRFVTPEGLAMGADGRVTAGPMAVGENGAIGGILERRTELESVQERLESLRGDLTERREELRNVDEESADLHTHRSAFQAELAEHQRQLVAEVTNRDRLGADLSRLERERGATAEDIDQTRRLVTQIDRDQAELRSRAASLERLHEEQTAAAAELERRLGVILAEAEASTERLTAAKVETGRIVEQLSAARREKGRMDLALEEARQRNRELSRHAEQARARQAEHTAAIAEAECAIEAAAAETARLSGQVGELAGRLAGAERAVSDAAERVAAARERAQGLERNWHSLEVARREVEVKRENLEQRTSDELELDLVAEYDEYREVMADGAVARIDTESTVAEIDLLRTEVRKLGNVNLDAIEEEANLVHRNEELIRQVEDLDSAQRTLTGLIDHLNTVSRERFGAALGKIQENFAGRDGMFRRLFGGGRAEVRLMPLVREVDGEKVQTNEVDLLESGIEVIAKPPGKEPRSISQLSGGERTLTSVALLMAIFQSKPSCFCVLDEVDAALDEANVDRFCTTVRRFTDRSHFIVITHNKRSMMEADRLYGVTMQERGVSKRVSVRFEDVARDGRIKPAEEKVQGTGRALRPALAAMRATSGTPQHSLGN